MKFNTKLIFLIFSLFLLTLGKNVNKKVAKCSDARCTQICTTKVEKGRPCNKGLCFPDGYFCYCQWSLKGKVYVCDNMKFTP